MKCNLSSAVTMGGFQYTEHISALFVSVVLFSLRQSTWDSRWKRIMETRENIYMDIIYFVRNRANICLRSDFIPSLWCCTSADVCGVGSWTIPQEMKTSDSLGDEGWGNLLCTPEIPMKDYSAMIGALAHFLYSRTGHTCGFSLAFIKLYLCFISWTQTGNKGKSGFILF